MDGRWMGWDGRMDGRWMGDGWEDGMGWKDATEGGRESMHDEKHGLGGRDVRRDSSSQCSS